MFAQYSPLFTSGLLSESNSPSTSRRPSVEFSPEPRPMHLRGSLPVDVSLDHVYEALTSEDDGILFTVAPSRRRRRSELGASFLSLDLASDARTLRSMSLRRKDTVTSRSTTHFGRSVPTSPDVDPLSPPMTFAAFSPIPSSSASLPRKSFVRHASREGLPGAKPVPGAQLPAIPQRPRRRPSDLTLTLSPMSPFYSGLSAPLPSTSLHRSSNSDPAVVSPISPLISPIERSYFAFSPPTSPPPALSSFADFGWDADIKDAPRSAPPEMPLRARPSVRSTASARTRQVNRSAALAALEGRAEGRPARRTRNRHRSRPKNFMSMSDDEDELDECVPSSFGLPHSRWSSSVLFPMGTETEEPVLLEVLQEEEDVVVPAYHATTKRSRKTSSPSSKKSSSSTQSAGSGMDAGAGRTRRGTLESLLSPLTNFIDFRDDDTAARSWRSFVEIS